MIDEDDIILRLCAWIGNMEYWHSIYKQYGDEDDLILANDWYHHIQRLLEGKKHDG